MSSISLDVDGYRFLFNGVNSAYIFDEKDTNSPHFHGGAMKAVDIFVELDKAFLFIEVKDYSHDMERFDVSCTSDDETKKEKRNAYKWLKDYLKYKFRDSYLYRHAEGMPEKEVHYLCLLTVGKSTLSLLKKELMIELPVGNGGGRWTKQLAKSVQVLDVDGWNRNFPAYKVSRI